MVEGSAHTIYLAPGPQPASAGFPAGRLQPCIGTNNHESGRLKAGSGKSLLKQAVEPGRAKKNLGASLTTPEGVAYKRASPLKRAEEGHACRSVRELQFHPLAFPERPVTVQERGESLPHAPEVIL